MANNPNNLGPKVTSRDFNWLDMVTRAWGSEFMAPDHGIYEMSQGRKFDSTDKGRTGIYGVVGEDANRIVAFDARYPDMRDGFLKNLGADQPLGAQNNGLGQFDELVLSNNPIPSPYPDPPASESDPYFSNVLFLIHASKQDFGPNAIPFADPTNILSVADAPSSIAGSPTALYQPLTTIKNPGTPTFNDATLALTAVEPFTFEFSIMFLSNGPPATAYFFHDLFSSGILSQVGSTGNYSIPGVSIASFTKGVWYQIAISFTGRNGPSLGTFYGFVNGVLVTAVSSGGYASSTNIFCLFHYSTISNNYPVFNGYMKEIRFTRGIQRYGATYTPRTTPFPNQ